MTMSASYFDLLKYAATGQASPSMTYYDKMRASALIGGYPERTVTGEPPLIYDCKKEGYLTAWRISGNGVQASTPTQTNPVPFDGSGERTGNIISEIISDKAIDASGIIYTNTNFIIISASVSQNEDYTFSLDSGLSDTTCRIHAYNGDTWIEQIRASNISLAPFTVTTPSGTTKLMISVTNGAASKRPMIVSGSTAPTSYIPYGWQITPTVTSGTSTQTTPIYLGSVESTRRIRKLVLTGKETIAGSAVTGGWVVTIYPSTSTAVNTAGSITAFCSHYKSVGNTAIANLSNGEMCVSTSRDTWLLFVTGYSAKEDFAQFLADEYSAGHPVTVWYILQTETAGIVNEPLYKIGTYADTVSSTNTGTPQIQTLRGQNTLSFPESVQPSEMSITYRG